jgi:hypothetical protein
MHALVVGTAMIDLTVEVLDTRHNPETLESRILRAQEVKVNLGGAGNAARILAEREDWEVTLLSPAGGYFYALYDQMTSN